MANFLQKVVREKQEEIAIQKTRVPLGYLKDSIADLPPTRDFCKAIQKPGEIAIIAEVKKASPSCGVIRPNFDPVALASTFAQHDAAAISVLTEQRYFMGKIEFLQMIRQRVALPLLRKDFIVDPYQIYESRAAGADAILLITAILSSQQVEDLLGIATELGLAALVEIHNQTELDSVLATNAKIIGINNRNLQTLQVDLLTTLQLAKQMPNSVVKVSESGIHSRQDIEKLAPAGIDAVLVGEFLMRSTNVGKTLQQLTGVAKC